MFQFLLGDALAYDAWAQRLAAGDWLGQEVFYQAPLYPYLLGLVYSLAGRDLMLVRVLQALLGATSCVLLAIAGGRLFGRRAGVAAGLLLALYAPAIFFDGLVQKSTVDLVLLCGLLVLLARLAERVSPAVSLAAGAVLGLLALTRENTLVFLPVLLAWVWLRGGRALKPVVVLAVGMAAVLGPVAWRNHSVGGSFHLTTSQAGPNLYIGNSEAANGTYVPLRSGYGNAAHERQDATRLAERALGRSLSSAQVSAYWRDRALDWISSHPGRWLVQMGKKLLLVWNRSEAVDTEDLWTYAEWSLPLRVTAPVFHFGLLAPLALLGMLLLRGRWRELWVLPAMAAVYTLSVALFYVLGRYRYPLVPILALLAGAAVASLPSWWKRSATRDRWLAAGVATIGMVVCNLPLLSASAMRSTTHFNLGLELQNQGRTEEATAQYREALALMPGNADAHSNLAALLAAAGRPDEAMGHLREALRANPDLAQAHNNVGMILAASGSPAEAVKAFRRAVELDPLDATACYNLATALAQSGRAEDAIHWMGEAITLQPGNAAAHNNLGIMLASTGEIESAIREFEEALRLEPGFAEARRNLGRARALSTEKR
jgi:Flp pilus assembly protein TadD